MSHSKEIGDFSIPSVNPLSAKALTYLREIVDADDEAKAVVDQVIGDAQPLLHAQPHPLAVIEYEGLVNTDPRRIATVEKLREMGDVARLVRYWQVTGDDRVVETLRCFIVAWTGTYVLTGNDVNENKFYPLLVAYLALRDLMNADEMKQVDAWVEALGERHLVAVENAKRFTNRYAKSVRLLAICGLIMNREIWVAKAQDGVKAFVTQSLFADGTSEDLKRRDTLTYHGSALKPVMELAMLSGDTGLYDWVGEQGGSIRKSVDYVVPYATGEQVREEWRHSIVDLDRRRSEAGVEKYRAGRLFEPKDALELMEYASLFDSDLLEVVQHLTKSQAKRFYTWQTLVNQVMRDCQVM